MESVHILDELLSYFESTLEDIETEYSSSNFTIPGSHFVSNIKCRGVSILPPLMTPKKREEMQMYRRQALMAETRMRARARQKLLARVQCVMKEIEERHQDKPKLESKESGDVGIQSDQTAYQAETGIDADGLSIKLSAATKQAEVQNSQQDSEDDLSSITITEGIVSKMKGEKMAWQQEVDSFASEIPTEKGDGQVQNASPRSVVTEGKDMSLFTLDSGISSRPPTTLTTEYYRDEHMDTMADITDISSSEEKETDSPRTLTNDGERYDINPSVKDQLVERTDNMVLGNNNTEIIALHVKMTRCNETDVVVESNNALNNREVSDSKPGDIERKSKQVNVKDLSQKIPGGQTLDRQGNVIASVKSTSSSGTTVSTETTVSSDEMNRTVIANDEAAYYNVEQPQILPTSNTCLEKITSGDVGKCNLAKEAPSEMSLLSKVALLSDDTPDITPPPSRMEDVQTGTKEDSNVYDSEARTGIVVVSECKKLQELGVGIETVTYEKVTDSSPFTTPDVSLISHVPTTMNGQTPENGSVREESVSSNMSSTPSTGDRSSIRSAEKKELTYGVQVEVSGVSHGTGTLTQSTDLAQHLAEDSGLRGTATAVTSDGEDSLHTRSTSNRDATPKAGHVGIRSSKENVCSLSYTLSHPSPVLLAAQARNEAPECPDQKQTKPTDDAAVTRSMEDLKLVQRKLSYDNLLEGRKSGREILSDKSSKQPKDPKLAMEVKGKAEHLQKYLEEVSSQAAETHQGEINTELTACDQNSNSSFQNESKLSQHSQTVQEAFENPFAFDMQALSVLSEKDLSTLQRDYFERLQAQLLEQQRQQLEQLLAEQKKQQFLFQQQIVEQEKQFIDRKEQASHGKSVQQRNTVTGHHSSFAFPSNFVFSESTVQVGDNARPFTAPTPRVSFSPDTDAVTTKRISGYEEPSYHDLKTIQENGEIDLESSAVAKKSPGGVWQSPVVMLTPEQSRQIRKKTAQSRTSRSPLCAVARADLSAEMQRKFNRVSAFAKGYLTRRLLKTDKVQQIIKTIRDTAEFAIHFQQETSIKKGIYSQQDKKLQDRVIAQLTAAMYEIHEVFFEISTKERMQIIAQSRLQEQDRAFKLKEETRQDMRMKKGVSAATIKAIERRRKIKAAEASVFGHVRPRTAPASTSCSRGRASTDLRAAAKEKRKTVTVKPEVTVRHTATGQSKRPAQVMKNRKVAKAGGISTKSKPPA